MDKQAERTAAESKSVERFFKRYETLLKDYSRKPDPREQIIEEQIEEYKRKREKILGDQSTMTFSLNEARKEQRESSLARPTYSLVESMIIKEENEGNKMDVEEPMVETNVNVEKPKVKTPKSQPEETNKKKENQQKEPQEQPCKATVLSSPADVERLIKILGEDNKNLQVTTIK